MCLLSSASESIKWTKETRQSALTFFMLSLDGLVQLPIIQTPLLDTNLTHSSPPAAQKFPPLWSYLSGFFLFFVFFKIWSSPPLFGLLRDPAQALNSDKPHLMCPMLVTSQHIWHHRDLIHSLRPSLSDPESQNKAAATKKHTHTQNELSTKSSSFLTSAASLSLSLHTDRCF